MLPVFRKHLPRSTKGWDVVLEEGIKLNVHSFDKPMLNYCARCLIDKDKWQRPGSQGTPSGRNERCTVLAPMLPQAECVTDLSNQSPPSPQSIVSASRIMRTQGSTWALSVRAGMHGETRLAGKLSLNSAGGTDNTNPLFRKLYCNKPYPAVCVLSGAGWSRLNSDRQLDSPKT